MKIPYFNYAAAAMLALIIVSAIVKKMNSVRSNTAFLITVAEVLLTTLFGIGSITFDNMGAGFVDAKYLFHAGYLLLHTLTAQFYLYYLITLTDTWYKLRRNYLGMAVLFAPSTLYIILFSVSAVTNGYVFYINEAGVYTRGPWFFINYIVGVLYLAMGMAYMFKYRKLFSNHWMAILIAPFPFIILATVIEFFYPSLVIELFFYALSLVFVYMNIQRPEESTDSGTGLGNPNAYETAMMRTYQNGKPVVVALMTILNYDSISDVLDFESNIGYKKEVASYLFELKRRLRLSVDMYYVNRGRFVLIFDANSKEKYDRAISMVSKHFNSSQLINNIEVRPSTSVCVINVPQDIPDVKTFLRFAKTPIIDTYGASTVYATDILAEKNFSILLKIERIILDALENHRLEVFYQPIYDVQQKRFISAEALLRLKDPTYGFISPAVFIPAAETSGYINKIWDFVIKSVCEFISSKEFESLGLEYIEVNLSAVQCMQERLAEKIFEQLDSANVSRDKIRVEITETAMMADSEILTRTLNRLNDGGIKICLDDYGTGYSNTRRLVDLPLSIVKIDKSFIQDIDRVKISNVVNEVVHMLNVLDVEIVAEGVETAEVLAELEACGVDYIQGYYFSPPMPQSKFVEFVRNYKG